MSIELKAVWAEKSYTITYDVAGYDSNTILLKAGWVKDPIAGPDISGIVKDEDGKLVGDAKVRLTQGSETIYGPATTDAQGEYLLSNLKPDIYNLVAEKDGQTVTVIVTIASDTLRQDLVLPSEKKNSILEVTGTDTPPVVVGNLEEIAKNTPLEGGSNSLTIKLTVKKEAEQTGGKETEHKEIRNVAGADSTILYLDAKLTKHVDSDAPINIGGSNNTVLEVVIPFDFAGKENVRVYRYHGGVDAFTPLPAKPVGAFMDETCYLDESAGLIHVYAKKYSTYAISYGTGGSGGSSGGSGTGNVVQPKPEGTPAPPLPTETGAAEWLNWESHIAYIVGNSDGLLHPKDSITRAEVAAIFYRLLRDDVRTRYEIGNNAFSDVPTNAWYHQAVSTLTNAKIISGRPNGTFAPGKPITRAEFAAIAARFSSHAYSGTDLFTDIGSHWGRVEINRAASYGWVNGVGDGTFAPNRNITRAEAVTLINRVLCRMPKDEAALYPGMKTWPDNQDTSKWYYLALQEATKGHQFRRTEDGITEEWTGLE